MNLMSSQTRRAISLAATVVLVLGACSSGATSAPSAAPASAAASTAPASAAPSTAAASTAPASAAAQGPMKIGLVLASTPVSRWKFDEQGFKDEVTKLGDTPIVVDSASTAQAQTAAVEGMITQGVKALVIAPADINTASALFDAAKAAGIPTIDYNFLVPDYAPNFIIERDARQFGQVTATEALKQHPTGNYVLVGGDPANSVAQDTTKGYLDILQPQVDAGKIKIVSQKFNTGWSPQSAQAQVEAALVKTNNDLAAALSNNDGMAIGVQAALDGANLLGKVFVSGVDADLPNLQAIAAGNQAITIWTNFTQMGEWAADLAVAAAHGTAPTVTGLAPKDNGTATGVQTVVMPAVVVSKDTLCSWTKQYQWATYDDVYKLLTSKPSC